MSPLEGMIALLRMAIVDEAISPEWIEKAREVLTDCGLGHKLIADQERKARGVMQPTEVSK